MDLTLRIGRWTLTLEVNREGNQWATTAVDDGVVHVHPLGDTVVHTLDQGCACGPTHEHVVHEGHMYTHHSLDGRERHEP